MYVCVCVSVFSEILMRNFWFVPGGGAAEQCQWPDPAVRYCHRPLFSHTILDMLHEQRGQRHASWHDPCWGGSSSPQQLQASLHRTLSWEGVRWEYLGVGDVTCRIRPLVKVLVKEGWFVICDRLLVHPIHILRVDCQNSVSLLLLPLFTLGSDSQPLILSVYRYC